MHPIYNSEYGKSVIKQLGIKTFTAEEARKVTLEAFKKMDMLERSQLRKASVEAYEKLKDKELLEQKAR